MIEVLGWALLELIIFGVMIIIIGYIDYLRDAHDWQWLLPIQVILVIVMLVALAIVGTYCKIAWYGLFI